MTRTKGSKNKTKKVITNGGQNSPEVFEAPAIEVEADQIVDEILENPATVLSSTGCLNCGHDIGLHYGTKDKPELKWCNRNGCQCLALQK